MRKDIKMLCVTNWNAVLELKTHPYYWATEYVNGQHEITWKIWHDNIIVADPNAIDAGMVIKLDEIKLVARIKR